MATAANKRLIFYVIFAFCMGLLVGFLGFYLFSLSKIPEIQTMIEVNKKVGNAPVVNNIQPNEARFQIFGEIINIEGQKIIVQEKKAPEGLGGKQKDGQIYQVTTNNQTTFVYQVMNSGTKQWENKKGNISELHKGLFISVISNEDVNKNLLVSAKSLSYTDKNPFLE